MSEGYQDDETRRWRIEGRSIGVGIVGGLLGGIGMGLLFQLGTDIMSILGAFLGAPSPFRGWVIHLALSLFLGAFFAAVLGYPPIRDFTASFGTLEYVLAGVTYVYAVAAVTIGVLPLVFELPGAADVFRPLAAGETSGSMAALIPAAAFALGHIIYGAILGAVYAVGTSRQ